MKATLELFKDNCARLTFFEEASPYFQTTVKMGKMDMQEETTKAVETALGVGFPGGNGTVAVLLRCESLVELPSFLCSTSDGPPSPNAATR